MLTKVGRPLIEIDWEQFDKLCELQATKAEIAGWFRCSEPTIERRIKEAQGVSFEVYYAEKKGLGKISLRRMQWKLAETSPAMAIFLGKNLLGQSDRVGLDHNGDVRITVRYVDTSGKADEELNGLDGTKH